MILKTASIIFLSSFLVGCASMFGPPKEPWPKPQRPNMMSIQFVPIKESGIKTNGYYLSEASGSNLVTNIQNMQCYILKLEILLESMAKVYNAKWELY